LPNILFQLNINLHIVHQNIHQSKNM